MYPQYALQPQPRMSFDRETASNPRFRSMSSSVPSSPTTSTHSNSRNSNNSNINRPIFFMTGPHTGKTIRMELFELQKADLGRKYAKVDRRPLDPPPVVLLKIYEVQTGLHGDQVETETPYDETQLLGLLCTVDLFPAPSADVIAPQSGGGLGSPSSAPVNTRTKFFPSSSPPASSDYVPNSELSRYQFYQEGSMPLLTRQVSGYVYPQKDTSDIVHFVDGFPITEQSKQTQALVGATFVQPAMIDYQGKKAIVFVFSDIAVKVEGTYLLRYRVFDIFGRRHDQELGITAEAYGGTFRVYSTKEFPGLSASTELTKLLARWGIRLNIRETERRRRKRTASGERRTPPDEGD